MRFDKVFFQARTRTGRIMVRKQVIHRILVHLSMSTPILCQQLLGIHHQNLKVNLMQIFVRSANNPVSLVCSPKKSYQPPSREPVF